MTIPLVPYEGGDDISLNIRADPNKKMEAPKVDRLRCFFVFCLFVFVVEPQ